MAKVTPLQSVPATTFGYREGDIARALAEALRHQKPAADIEAVFSDLVFLPADATERAESIWLARELLTGLVETYRPTPSITPPATQRGTRP